MINTPTKKQLDFESGFIAKQRDLVFSLLEEYYQKHPRVCAFEKAKTKKLFNRSFDSEIDFLYEESKEYFELYLQDHKEN
jgi:hypothetical protein